MFGKTRWAPAFSVTVALALTTVGCAAENASTPTSGPDSNATTSPSESPAAVPTPSIEPASGPVLEMPAFAFYAPEGWELSPQSVDFILSAQDLSSGGVMSISDQSLPGLTDFPALDDLAQTSIRSGGWSQEPTAGEPRTVKGVQLYHVSGQVSEIEWLDEYGGFYKERLGNISIMQDVVTSAAERDALVESVLASVVWK